MGRPGVTYATDDEGRVLAANGVPASVRTLPDEDLREAAARGSSGSVGAWVPAATQGVARVLSWAPVSGQGPSGALGWAVVVDRPVTELVEPDTRYRVPGILFGLMLALVTLAVFGWIALRVLQPLDRLEDVAERVAYGDLRRPVPAMRYDEVGRIARALERMRLQMIGRRARAAGSRPEDPADDDPGRNP